jgi:predicted nuclease of predicted toxin-antitoxin system
VKFKLDENLGWSVRNLIQDAGHDCRTVIDEGLSGAPDRDVLDAAVSEKRVLVTMDNHFGNVFAYPPRLHQGVALLSAPGGCSRQRIEDLVKTLLEALTDRDITGRLWIIEPGRIRIHESEPA